MLPWKYLLLLKFGVEHHCCLTFSKHFFHSKQWSWWASYHAVLLHFLLIDICYYYCCCALNYFLCFPLDTITFIISYPNLFSPNFLLQLPQNQGFWNLPFYFSKPIDFWRLHESFGNRNYHLWTLHDFWENSGRACICYSQSYSHARQYHVNDTKFVIQRMH